MITCCAVLRGKREATKSDRRNLSLVNRQDNVLLFSKQKRTLYIYIYIIFLLLGSSYSHRVWVLFSAHEMGVRLISGLHERTR